MLQKRRQTRFWHVFGNRAASGLDTYLNSGSTYGYDQLNRLVSATVNGTATAYSYDRYGNRVSQTPGPTVQPLTGNNQLQGFSYDAAGNLLQDAAGNQYQYDAEDNVLAVTNRGIAWTYDAFNQRVRVEENGVNYEFDYDSSGRRVSVWQGNTRVQGQYYAGGMGVGYYANGMTRFQHKDWLGTERIRTRPDGSVEGRFYQGAFGDNLQIQGADTDGAHFAGQDADVSNGTSHAQFRELDITHGKWMSPDPYDGSYDLSNPQSLNRYSYALNNPLTYRDPSGLYCEYEDDEFSGQLEEVDYNSSEGECGLTGGNWYPDGSINVGGNGTQNIVYVGSPTVGTSLGNQNGFPSGSTSTPPTQTSPAPSKPGQPSQKSCGGILVKGAIQTGLDALGAIPGEALVSLTAKEALVGGQVLAGFGSTAISVASRDRIGISAGATGTTLSVLSVATEGIKGAAELIPGIGQAVAIGSSLWDIGSTAYEYAGCRGWRAGG